MTTGVRIPLRDHVFNVGMAAAAAPFLPRLPRTTVEDMFPGISQLEISLSHDVRSRALAHGEAFVLSLITAWKRPRRIFEIGTASGQGSLLMARQAPEARIDTLDLGSHTPTLGAQAGEGPWQDVSAIGHAFRDAPEAERITQHFGDSATFDYGPFRHAVDLIFVDGAHTRPYVRSDSRNALEMAAPGAVIVWDDCSYMCPGVSRALLELRSDGHDVHRLLGTRFAALRTPG